MVNKVILIGNLGSDPEVRSFENGNKMAKFSLATSRKYKNAQGERQEDTQWHNIVVFGNSVDVAERYLTKGSKIYVDGEIQYRQYENESGEKKYFTEIRCMNFQMMGGTPQTGAPDIAPTQKQKPKASPKAKPAATKKKEVEYEDDDDLPF